MLSVVLFWWYFRLVVFSPPRAPPGSLDSQPYRCTVLPRVNPPMQMQTSEKSAIALFFCWVLWLLWELRLTLTLSSVKAVREPARQTFRVRALISICLNQGRFEIFQIFQDWNISLEIFDFGTFLNISNISGNI